MPHSSAPALLALHGVRILGWVRRTAFADSAGWSVTDAGRQEDERQLAEELDAAGARQVAVDVHAAFLPLNRRLARACTRWQVRPQPWDPMAVNDHSDWAWDEDVLRTLASLGDALDRICAPLVQLLPRFDGHVARYRQALERVDRGDRAWVDGPDRASAHLVWIQLHEDLLATLGIERGTDG